MHHHHPIQSPRRLGPSLLRLPRLLPLPNRLLQRFQPLLRHPLTQRPLRVNLRWPLVDRRLIRGRAGDRLLQAQRVEDAFVQHLLR